MLDCRLRDMALAQRHRAAIDSAQLVHSVRAERLLSCCWGLGARSSPWRFFGRGRMTASPRPMIEKRLYGKGFDS